MFNPLQIPLLPISHSLPPPPTAILFSNKSAVKKQHKTEHNKNGKINFHKKLSSATSERKLIFAVMIGKCWLIEFIYNLFKKEIKEKLSNLPLWRLGSQLFNNI